MQSGREEVSLRVARRRPRRCCCCCCRRRLGFEIHGTCPSAGPERPPWRHLAAAGPVPADGLGQAGELPTELADRWDKLAACPFDLAPPDQWGENGGVIGETSLQRRRLD